ncbi:MAG: vanadium-dependent haloperoxidase [Cyclobacteriaceae bacterium]
MRRNALILLIIFSIFSCTPASMDDSRESAEVLRGEENVVHQWGLLALKATAHDTERFNPRPTITSRFLALVFVSVFDAWSRYDEKAIPVYLANVERRPSREHTLSNKRKAVSFAAYHALKEYYPFDSTMFRDYMVEMGLEPDRSDFPGDSPEGIGIMAAKATIEARYGDGSNQYGEEEGSNHKPYFNYTGYQPVNSADENVDPSRWQPKYFADGKGGYFAPECLTPFWDKVRPIGLESPDQFRPGPPPEIGSQELKDQVWEVIELQRDLTDEQKALVEFMRDGPESVQQAGHWLRFALDVSRRDQHTLDEDVKMLFYNQVTAMDAFIAAWDSKMYYDYARPYALVHEYYEGEVIKAWAGKDKGMQEITGEQWRPYSPETFLCPPFPSYVSGHSAVSGACGEALKLWTGSDEFGIEVELVAGAMTEPDHLGDTVVLKFPTFTETSEMAGLSRVLGGYHIQADNVEGLELGRNVARQCWKFYKKHMPG